MCRRTPCSVNLLAGAASLREGSFFIAILHKIFLKIIKIIIDFWFSICIMYFGKQKI